MKGAKIIGKEDKTRKARFFRERGIKLREELKEDKDLEFIKPGEMDKGK